MFRTTVRATDQSDVESEVARLRTDCERAGLVDTTVDRIALQVREALSDLVLRGRELAAMGSQMTVTRSIAGEGYEVMISFNARKHRSLFARIANALGLR